jgi:hypothetical protein
MFDPPEADKCLLACGELDVHFQFFSQGKRDLKPFKQSVGSKRNTPSIGCTEIK